LQPVVKREVVDKNLLKMNKTLGWLADELELNQSYLSKILNGERNPSPAVREKLMNIFSIKNWDHLFIIKEP
jgi:transcriptional regulator with XRE-family HTH domain